VQRNDEIGNSIHAGDFPESRLCRIILFKPVAFRGVWMGGSFRTRPTGLEQRWKVCF
jgi:hypothetical protein